MTHSLPAIDPAKVAQATEEHLAIENAELREHVASLQADVAVYSDLYHGMYDAIVQTMRERDRFEQLYRLERAELAAFRERIMLGEQVAPSGNLRRPARPHEVPTGLHPVDRLTHEGASCH